MVSVMLANSETGTLQPVREIVEITRAHGVFIHCDAAQAVGKVPMNADSMEVDFLTFSAHKAYGPKGIGCVYRRKRRPPIRLEALLHGGGQEDGLRSGTPNLPAIVGMAEAYEIASAEWCSDSERVGALRDLLEDRLRSGLHGCTINGSIGHRLPGTTNVSFSDVDGNALLASLPDLAVSSGSACASAHPEPSYVLRAMGVDARLAAASIRLSLGKTTTEEEIERAADRVIEEVQRLRGMRGRHH